MPYTDDAHTMATDDPVIRRGSIYEAIFSLFLSLSSPREM